MGEGRRGHFVAKHERLVQPTGASGQHRREYFQGVGVGMPRRRRVPQDVHLRIGLRLGVHSLLNFLCHFLGDDLRRIALTPRDALEVALAQLGRLVGLEVADQNQRDVLRRIVQCVKLVSLRLGDGRDVRRPADHWPAVRMRLPEHRLERFLKFAKRRGLGAHAALLEHHVALGVKLAEHRPQQPLRLHPRPKLELVRRHGNEVAGHVVGREGVHAGRAGGGVDAVELVLDEHLALRGDQFLELGLKFAVALGLVFRLGHVVDLAAPQGQPHLGLLPAHGVAHHFLLINDLGVALGIARADGRRALEHHVLEEVRDAGDAGALVDAADARHPSAGDGRRVVPLDHEQFHAVGERALINRHLLRLAKRHSGESDCQAKRLPKRPAVGSLYSCF